jgi:hypothetical protein
MPADVRKSLPKRCDRKALDPQRVARRFPQHEALVERILAMAVEHSAGGSATNLGEINGHQHHDTVSELVRLAALLEGLQRSGGNLEEEQLAPISSEVWRGVSELLEAAPADETPLAQVLAAEVLFASSILFEDASEIRDQRKDARAKLIAELEARTETDGMPHASLLPILPAWFASLTRCMQWARKESVPLWNAEYAGRFDGLLRAVATVTAGPSLAFCGETDMRPVLKAALKCSGWKSGSPVGRLVRRIVKSSDDQTVPSREIPLRKIDRKSPPASQSDWAKLVISRSRWSDAADSLVIAHHSAIPSIEFAAFGQTILSGAWDFRVRIDDADLPLPRECDAVCWFSDADADYVELQWTTTPGVVICRQAMLTRGDHQLFLADSVSSPSRPEARIEIESTLPLVKGTTGESLRPKRELRLKTDRNAVRCFPMALPMDRLVRSAGAIEPEIDRLVVRQSGTGAAYAPLLFDWHPQRRELPADWRLLTVTEDGRKLAVDAAVGCRVRVGKRQMLFYRNLNGSKTKRAVLGHHHDHETVIGRFTSQGEVDPLVFVE